MTVAGAGGGPDGLFLVGLRVSSRPSDWSLNDLEHSGGRPQLRPGHRRPAQAGRAWAVRATEVVFLQCLPVDAPVAVGLAAGTDLPSTVSGHGPGRGGRAAARPKPAWVRTGV